MKLSSQEYRKRRLFTEIQTEWKKLRENAGVKDIRIACDLDHTRPTFKEPEKH